MLRSCTCTWTCSPDDRAVLVHDDRLDDVELPRRRRCCTDASIVLYDGNPGTPTSARCGISPRRRGVTCFGASAALHRGLPARPASSRREGRDLVGARAVGSTGSPLAPEGFAWVYEQRRRDIWLFSTSGGTDVCTALRRRRADAARLPGRDAGARARRHGRGLGRARRPLVDEVGELVITEPMPSMPLYFWDDPDGRALPRELLRDVPGRLAPRRLDRDHRRAARRSSPAAPTRRSTGTGSGWARPRSTARCSHWTRSSTRSCVDLPLPGHRRATCRCSSCSAPGIDLDDELVAQIRRGSARTAPRATFPTRSTQIAEVPRTLSGKVLELPVKRILLGSDPDTTVSRDSLASPAALDPFVQLQRDGTLLPR